MLTIKDPVFPPSTIQSNEPSDPNSLEDASLFFNFIAQRATTGICLKWSTASEKDLDRFDILHSMDGVHYSKITYAAARGNSDFPSNYAWVHNTPSNYNYYCLQQFYKNGRINYSDVVQISLHEN